MPRAMKNQLPPLDLGPETVGQRIASLRKKRGLTQETLAQQIGISKQLISDYETGRLHLSDDMLTRISLALKVSADILLGLEKKNLDDGQPSLRILKRLNLIEKLPVSEQKALLKTIDKYLQAPTTEN
jgi:transcriptional regulator with XRE-family HTH domain